MVPISKSIWPPILFVCANFHSATLVRLNLFCCFSSFSSRERSKPCPPNFALPFCALCLIVYDFLPKTWDLGRKEGKSALSGRAPLPSAPVGRSHTPPFVATRHLPPAGGSRPSRGRLNPLSHRCAMPAPPKGELLALPQTSPLCLIL